MKFTFLLNFNESTPDYKGKEFTCIAPTYDDAVSEALFQCDRLWSSNPKYDPNRAVWLQLEDVNEKNNND